jgi:hypothetical protein
MKKIMLALIFTAISTASFAWVCDGCPRAYMYNFDNNEVLGARSYLPDMASELESGHGIKVFIKIENSAENYGVEKAAKDYFASLALGPADKAIVVFNSGKQHESYIALTDNLTRIFPKKYVTALQDDVLGGLQGKWYVGFKFVLAKVLGSFVYMLERGNMTKAQIESRRPYMIIVDDPLYNVSLMPVINDVIRLFYMEPVSFIFYFPFIMYFLIVRWIGCNTDRRGFIISNVIWGAAMLFFAALIANRINIYFNEYVVIFTVICGFNIPVYAALFAFYRDRIESAAYNYLNDVTGGFDKLNAFGGNRWEK